MKQQPINIFSDASKRAQYQIGQRNIEAALESGQINGDELGRPFFSLDHNDLTQISSFLSFYYTELGQAGDLNNIVNAAKEFVEIEQSARFVYEKDKLDTLHGLLNKIINRKIDVRDNSIIQKFLRIESETLIPSKDIKAIKDLLENVVKTERKELDKATFGLMNDAIDQCHYLLEKPSPFQKTMGASWFCIADTSGFIASTHGGVVVKKNDSKEIYSKTETEAFRKASFDYTIAHMKGVADLNGKDFNYEKAASFYDNIVKLVNFPEFPKNLEGYDLKTLGRTNDAFIQYFHECRNATRKLYRINDEFVPKLSDPKYTPELLLLDIQKEFGGRALTKAEQDAKNLAKYAPDDIAKLREQLEQKAKKKLKEISDDFEDEYSMEGIGGLGVGLGVGLLLAPFTFGLSLVVAPAIGLVAGDVAGEAYQKYKVRNQLEVDKARLDNDPAFIDRMVGEYNKDRGHEHQIYSYEEKISQERQKADKLAEENSKLSLKAKRAEEELAKVKKTLGKHGVWHHDDTASRGRSHSKKEEERVKSRSASPERE